MEKVLTHGQLQQYLIDCSKNKESATTSMLDLFRKIDSKNSEFSSSYHPDFYSWSYQDNQSLLDCIYPLPMKKIDIREGDKLHFNSVEHLSCFLCLTNDHPAFVTNDCFTIYYHISGTARISVNEKNLDLTPGTMVIHGGQLCHRDSVLIG